MTSLAKDFLILFTFPKNQLLVSLIIAVVLLVSISFISPLIFANYFHLPPGLGVNARLPVAGLRGPRAGVRSLVVIGRKNLQTQLGVTSAMSR